jgi:hypothetical protein
MKGQIESMPIRSPQIRLKMREIPGLVGIPTCKGRQVRITKKGGLNHHGEK